jgi:pyruvate/2-oxoglutarate/acetoin dehydrogenase E1 component
MGEFRTPLGMIETTKEGGDITLVTYGSTWRIVTAATKLLEEAGILAEVIDIQTLVPFDLNHDIVESIKKTNRLLVIDEDVPGGASAYIMQKIIEEQKAFYHLDSEPQTLSAKAHRPAYGKDGDYFSKPSIEDVFEKVYAIMHEANPVKYPQLY